VGLYILFIIQYIRLSNFLSKIITVNFPFGYAESVYNTFKWLTNVVIGKAFIFIVFMSFPFKSYQLHRPKWPIHPRVLSAHEAQKLIAAWTTSCTDISLIKNIRKKFLAGCGIGHIFGAGCGMGRFFSAGCGIRWVFFGGMRDWLTSVQGQIIQKYKVQII